MDVDSTDDPSVHRLEASAPTTGGLVIKNKSSSGTFKVSKPSLLGLDRLAVQKRKERDDAERPISFKDSEYDDTIGPDGTPIRTPDDSSVHKLSRHYRETADETPSHSGGVSDKARDRQAERSDKDRRGIAYSSEDRKRSHRDDDADAYDRRDRRERRDHDRRSRDREHGRDRQNDRSEHRHRNRSESEEPAHAASPR